MAFATTRKLQTSPPATLATCFPPHFKSQIPNRECRLPWRKSCVGKEYSMQSFVPTYPLTGRTVTRAGFITALAGGALSFRCLAGEETPDEKAVYDALDAAVDAQFTYDFRRITTLLHPRNKDVSQPPVRLLRQPAQVLSQECCPGRDGPPFASQGFFTG